MPECSKCRQPIEWRKSEKTGNNYPINAGKKPGDEDYFHSKTCKPKTVEQPQTVEQKERVDGYFNKGNKVDSTIRDIVDAIKELTNEVRRCNEIMEKEHGQTDRQDP